VKVSDRIRRWWNPARWADDHPESLGSKVEAYAEKYAASKTAPHESGYPSSGGTAEH
jgi:hypothetical protein